MIRISADSKAAYKSDSSVKTVEIRIPDADLVLTNGNILMESLELKEAIETGDNLTFTGCIASSLSFECFNLVDETLEGMWIEADILAEIPGDEETEFETVPLFRGYIDEVTNTTHEEFTTKIRAYDALYTINSIDVTAWRNSIIFPISIINLRNSFFNYIGVPQKSDFLPNDGILITAPQIEDAVVTGGKILKAICSINGRFGRIGRDGYFEYVHLVEGTEAIYPANDLYPSEDLYPHAENAVDSVAKAYYSSLSFENYKTVPIDKVQLVNKSGAISASTGTGANTFTLKDNPLVWGLNQASLNQVVANLYNTIKGIWYVPAQVECVGLPYLECGDFVILNAQRSIVRAYVLQRTLKGVQALTDSFVAIGDKTQPKYVPTIQSQVNANSEAISNETTRASSAESNLNAGLNNANNRINQVDADLINTKTIVTGKANISDLNATNANVNNLSTQIANVNNLIATKASIEQLNAVNAKFNNYQAKIGQNTFLTAGGLTVTGYCRVGGYDLSTYIGRIRSAVNSLYSQQGAIPPL